jgi:hypothetical protein
MNGKSNCDRRGGTYRIPIRKMSDTPIFFAFFIFNLQIILCGITRITRSSTTLMAAPATMVVLELKCVTPGTVKLKSTNHFSQQDAICRPGSRQDLTSAIWPSGHVQQDDGNDVEREVHCDGHPRRVDEAVARAPRDKDLDPFHQNDRLHCGHDDAVEVRRDVDNLFNVSFARWMI